MDIEDIDITCPRVDMNLSSSVQLDILQVSAAFNNYKHTNDNVFDNFLKISDHFLKISEDFLKLSRRADKCFCSFSDHIRTFSNDYRRLLKTSREDLKMF